MLSINIAMIIVSFLVQLLCVTGCAAQSADSVFDLESPVVLSVGKDPFRICVTDCTGDNKPEIVVTNIGENTISIFATGKAGITPLPDSPLNAGQQPYWVVSTDWDVDGIVDLIVSNHQSDRISILRGLGKKRFAPPASIQVPTDEHVHKIAVGYNTKRNSPFIITERFLIPAESPNSPVRLPLDEHSHDYLASDLNGDGNTDIALINGLESRFALLLGNNAGGFFHAEGSPSHAFGEPQSIRLGDKNSSGNQSLIISARKNAEYPAGLFIVQITEKSFVIERIETQLQGISASIDTGDISGDGDTDIVVRLIDKPGLAAMLSSPTGFNSSTIPIDFPIRHFVLVDINDNGKDDLAVLNDQTREVFLFRSK